MKYLGKLKYLLFFIIIVFIIIIFFALYLFFIVPINFNQSSLENLNNTIKNSNTKFTKELWFKDDDLIDDPRLTLYNDLHDNYLTKNFKYDHVENLLGKPDYNRVYDGWLYKRTCKQYYLGEEISFGVVSLYMIVCPDKNYEYVEDVYTLSYKSFLPTLDSGKEVAVFPNIAYSPTAKE